MGCSQCRHDQSLSLRCVFPPHQDTSRSGRWRRNTAAQVPCTAGRAWTTPHGFVLARRGVGLPFPLPRPGDGLRLGVLPANPLLRGDPCKHGQVLVKSWLVEGQAQALCLVQLDLAPACTHGPGSYTLQPRQSQASPAHLAGFYFVPEVQGHSFWELQMQHIATWLTWKAQRQQAAC